MRTYTLTQPAYGKQPGETVKVDENDPLVQINVENGVLSEDPKVEVKPSRMTCPICMEHMQRPPKFDGESDLAEHYQEKHAGFAVPAWAADNEGEVK